jgi:DNA polymerase-3 subunit gamma/tau
MSEDTKQPGYQVVARRYRPQTFEDVVGQQHVVRGLSNAIAGGRVAHAYLFTGARGVGKTSSARILAKALNCERGLSATPCNVCPTCRSISTGDDVDVLEIDGASNRGIDEMRSLRQNAGVRPIHSRFKIYIIDEVHMLTREAFNALLKTLEEPPEHVKFVFCTTEAEKIPITILSRCQRFDFASIDSESITTRLQHIAEQEGYTLEAAAATALARRAGGSMRDSQSLLEQLLAFGNETITAASVHAMLGTADEARVTELMSSLVNHDAAGVLAHVDAAVADGVDLGQLLDQVLGYCRDLMVTVSGASDDLLRFVDPSQFATLKEQGEVVGLETTLAIMQIIAETKQRLRYSTQTRILTELCLVRASRLGNLDELANLIAVVRSQSQGGGASRSPRLSGSTSAADLKKKPLTAPEPRPGPTASSAPASNGHHEPVAQVDPHTESEPQSETPKEDTSLPQGEGLELTEANAASVWKQALRLMSELVHAYAEKATNVAILGPNRLALGFPSQYTFHRKSCERPERLSEIEAALARVCGTTIKVTLGDAAPGSASLATHAADESVSARPNEEVGSSPSDSREESGPDTESAPSSEPSRPAPPEPVRLTFEQIQQEVEQRPILKRTTELFDAHVLRFDAARPEEE